MARRAFAYRLAYSEVAPTRDVDYQRASPETQEMVGKWVVAFGLKEKDADLARGLDKDGNMMVPISAQAWKYRESAMGPADPNAPPLTPSHAVSRTRLLLEGTAYKDHAEFYWTYDENTGDSWGKVLSYHRLGIGRFHRIKRNVFGLSPDAVQRVRDAVLERWRAFKLHGLRTPTRPQPPQPTIPVPRIRVIGRTDVESFTFGVGGPGGAEQSRRALNSGYSTGFFQRRAGQGLPAFGGPGTTTR